jgi:hypothetical protein
MALNKSFWKTLRFVKGEDPNLICPTCNKGIIKGITGTFKAEDTADTKALQKSNYPFTEMDVDFRFSTLLRCNNPNCQEVISCLGTGYYDQHDELQPGHIYPTYYKYYSPEYFSIPLHIIEIKDSYPKEIKKALIASFKVFFCDSEACANKIRTVVEILLDLLKVKYTIINRHRKRVGLPLHARIIEYRKKNQQLADLLLAVKWIGNSGSHDSKITKDDTLDAYRILEYVLTKLYANNEAELIQMASQINKMKRAPSLLKKKK